MEQDILSNRQRAVIAAVAAEPNLARFYLTGGTALAAYYFHHRISDDLDFFTSEECDPVFLHVFAEGLTARFGAIGLRFGRLYDRYQFFFQFPGRDELKIEFAKYPFPQLVAPSQYDGVLVDGLRDVAANKLMALLDRFDPKDFVDLFFVLKERPLEEVRRDVEIKFGITVDQIFLGGELMKARRIEALPKMVKPLTIEELKIFFADLARKLGAGILE